MLDGEELAVLQKGAAKRQQYLKVTKHSLMPRYQACANIFVQHRNYFESLPLSQLGIFEKMIGVDLKVLWGDNVS
jgi:hypothetical protein